MSIPVHIRDTFAVPSSVALFDHRGREIMFADGELSSVELSDSSLRAMLNGTALEEGVGAYPVGRATLPTSLPFMLGT